MDQTSHGKSAQQQDYERQQAKIAEEKKSFWYEVWDWTRTIVITIIIALLFQNFVFTLARVDGESMMGTLLSDQRMAVLRIHYYFTEPQRGHVVLCRYPDFKEDCVKRVIGLPGETVSGMDGRVYINGEALDEPYLTFPDMYDFDPVTVPENSYFVVGDNRLNSLDSRSIGALPRDQIKGQCLAVVFPFDEIGGIPTE